MPLIRWGTYHRRRRKGPYVGHWGHRRQWDPLSRHNIAWTHDYGTRRCLLRANVTHAYAIKGFKGLDSPAWSGT